MRSKLTRSISLRQAPFLKFHIDENVRKEIAVLELIRKAALEEDELARSRAGAAGSPVDAPDGPPVQSTTDDGPQTIDPPTHP